MPPPQQMLGVKDTAKITRPTITMEMVELSDALMIEATEAKEIVAEAAVTRDKVQQVKTD